MRINKEKTYGIVTGDVIASSRLSSRWRRELPRSMYQASKAVRKAFSKAVPMGVDISRGDSWQILLVEPALALRVSLFYRAYLCSSMVSHRFDTRMVIALGTVDFVPGRRVSEGDGPAYRLSGKKLESMHCRDRIRMQFVYPGHPLEKEISVVVQLVDGLGSRWSDKQALAVTGALQGWKQDKIAKECWDQPITQQAVAQHLNRAGWSYIQIALQFFEEALQQAPARQAK